MTFSVSTHLDLQLDQISHFFYSSTKRGMNRKTKQGQTGLENGQALHTHVAHLPLPQSALGFRLSKSKGAATPGNSQAILKGR